MQSPDNSYQRKWIEAWVSLLWFSMTRTGRGYKRQPTARRSGLGDDRRPDKTFGVPKQFRRYQRRFG